MTEDGQVNAPQVALNCYLATLLATANALAQACPEVGGIYRHRLTRLRARVAFDSSPKALEESQAAVESEIKEYGAEASAYATNLTGELRSALGSLEELIHHLVQRQDFYASRLRNFAAQMEAAHYPGDPMAAQELMALQSAGLASCVDSMSHETQSLLARVREELTATEQRIKEAAMTDPLTGLMNRREMDRRIEAFQSLGAMPVMLHFRLIGEITEEVTAQVAARLASQFRHKDFIGRWTDTEFMVLFQGPAEVARARSERIVPWVAGQYVVDEGRMVEVGIEVALLEPALEPSAV